MKSRKGLGVRNLIAVSIFLAVILFVPAAVAEYPELSAKVMTCNMYPGAELAVVAAARDEAEFQSAILAVIDKVIQSRIPDRAALLANEITANLPDLISLQEATRWQIESTSGPIVLDQLELLLASLEASGVHYKKALVHTLTNVVVPDAVTYTDRDVILMRSDLPPGHLKILGTETHLFDHLMVFPVLDGEITVLQGWMAVDVKIRGARFKFVNTHLFAPLPDSPETQDLQFAQAFQLVEDLKATSLPIIMAGDFNSDAEPTHNYAPDATLSYGYIVGSGYEDAWEKLYPDDPGFTWPLMLEVGVPEDPIERIDLIFSKGAMAFSIAKTGMEPAPDGLLASDHAGMVASLSLENHRPDKEDKGVERGRGRNGAQAPAMVSPRKGKAFGD
jgi:endonuclease/exonuclease/phosphatase family metal-dependent hydrolase